MAWLFTRRIVSKPLSKDLDYQSFLLTKAVLGIKKKLDFNVSGISMRPLYKSAGEIASVEAVGQLEDLKRFDVIIFWQNNTLIIHYFWGVCKYFNEDPSNPTILTRPLNPIRAFDHPIYFDRILGVVNDKKIGFWLRVKIYLSMF